MILASYDPYLMLMSGNQYGSDIVQLLQIDINQYWLKTHGKARLFAYFDYLNNVSNGKQNINNIEMTVLGLTLLMLMVTLFTRLMSIFHTWSLNYQRIREEINETLDDVLAIRNQHLQNQMANMMQNQQQPFENEEE